MLFIIECIDKPESTKLRTENRPAHLDYLRSAGERLKLAGPLLDEESDNPQPIGTMVILDAGSLTAAHLFAENDPYRSAGLFASVTVRPWRNVLGAWNPANSPS